MDFSYCECSNTEHKRERVPRRLGWPRVSSEKISIAIIKVFCNIYLDTHNTIESIEMLGAAYDLLCEKSIIITSVFVLFMLKYKTKKNSCEWVGVTKGLWFENSVTKIRGFSIIHFEM